MFVKEHKSVNQSMPNTNQFLISYCKSVKLIAYVSKKNVWNILKFHILQMNFDLWFPLRPSAVTSVINTMATTGTAFGAASQGGASDLTELDTKKILEEEEKRMEELRVGCAS